MFSYQPKNNNMMKKNLFWLFVALATVFVSCEKDDTGDDDSSDDPKEQFSTYGYEKDKENIQDEGLAMLDDMEALADEPAVDYTESMVHFVDKADPFEGNEDMGAALMKSTPIKLAYAVSKMGEYGHKVVKASLKSAVSDDPESLEEIWDMVKGTYAWNHNAQSWDYTEGNDLVFLFPSDTTKTTNNAEYRITYQGEMNSYTFDGETLESEMPTSITIVLKVDNIEVMSFIYAAEWVQNDLPKSISVTYTIGTFVLEASFSNTSNAELEFLYSVTHGNEILMKTVFNVKGDFSFDNLSTQIENEKLTNILDEGDVLYQVMGIKLVGNINFANVEDKLQSFDEEDDVEQDSAKVQEIVDLLNANVEMSARYVADDMIIANGEFYKDSYEDYDYIYNEETYQWEEVTYTGYEVLVQLVFADGSKMDIDDYFDDGFETVENDYEDFFDGLGWGFEEDEEPDDY
jgi:hypothetical protein